MPSSHKLKYQSCRETAGLTQEQASVLLGIEPSTLSRYENGHYHVPDDIVAAMVKVYRTPTLALWHVRFTHPEIAPYLPKPKKLETYGDLMLRVEFAEDDLSSIRSGLKEIFRDGIVTPDEAERLERKTAKYIEIAHELIESAEYMQEQALKAFEKEGGENSANLQSVYPVLGQPASAQRMLDMEKERTAKAERPIRTSVS